MAKDLTDLTPKQEAFCQEYVLNGNDASAAYRKIIGSKAGPQSVWAAASRMLSIHKVTLRVQALTQLAGQIATEKFEVTAERVLAEVAAIAFYDPADYFEWDADKVTLKASKDLTRRQRAAVMAVTQTTGQTKSIKLDMGSKLQALEKLGKHLGMFKEDRTVNVNVHADSATTFDSRLVALAARAISDEVSRTAEREGQSGAELSLELLGAPRTATTRPN